MRKGNLYSLVLAALFAVPCMAMEYVQLDSLGYDAVQYYRLPHRVLVLFVTDQALHVMLPDPCKEEEKKGYQIHGYFERETISAGQVYVRVSNPRHWDQKLLSRCGKLFGDILADNEDAVLRDSHDFSDDDWDRAGVLFHELCHLCDNCWWGKPATMMHELFPDLTPAAPADEHDRNPWQALRTWWPQWCTHKGYDDADYPKMAGHAGAKK